MTFLSTNSSREGLLEDVTLNLNLRCNFFAQKNLWLLEKIGNKKNDDFKDSGFQPRRTYLDLRTEVLNLSLCLGLICNNKESAGRNLENFFDAINLAITNHFLFLKNESFLQVSESCSRPLLLKTPNYSKSLLHVKWKIPLNKINPVVHQ